jgi:glycosyltransferase involved in cell wall biosynthesis
MEQKFSVLLNVYAKDRPVWIKQAIESVLTNTISPAELVIMVDGPIGKEIQEVLEESKKNKTVRILSNPVNIGRGAALSLALLQCNYNLIALMDADDVSRSDRFEKQLDAFANNPDLSVLGGQIQEVDSDTFTPIAQRKVPLTHNEIRRYIKTRMPFNNVTVMFKKDVVLEAGNYKTFGTLEDYYMWARVIAKEKIVQNLSDVLVDVRVGKEMYNRRKGWEYFKINKRLFDEMKKLKLLNFREYYYTLSVRFIVQVLMPNWLRNLFYKKVLR